MKALKATLLASAIGTAAWLTGIHRSIWPAHPMWAVFFLTVGSYAILMFFLPETKK